MLQIRTVVDINEHIELSKLSIKDALYVGLAKFFTSSKSYKKKQIQEQNKLAKDKQKSIKQLVSALKIVLRQLDEDSNKSSLKLTINRQKDSILDDVLFSKDFLGYNFERIKDNPDMLLSFPELPIMVNVTKRRLDGN